MHSINDVQKNFVFVYWEKNNFSFRHPFTEIDSQLMAKKLDGGETKTALSWKRTDSMQT